MTSCRVVRVPSCRVSSHRQPEDIIQEGLVGVCDTSGLLEHNSQQFIQLFGLHLVLHRVQLLTRADHTFGEEKFNIMPIKVIIEMIETLW